MVDAGMKSREQLDQWSPALPPLRRPERSGERIVLKILEICSGCGSVSAPTAKEARELGFHAVQVFSIDGKPGTGATRMVDLLTYDWANDAELKQFRGAGSTCPAHRSVLDLTESLHAIWILSSCRPTSAAREVGLPAARVVE